MKKISPQLRFLLFLHILFFSLGFSLVSAYSYAGHKWNDISVNYYINNTFTESFRTAMQEADSTWDNAGSKLRFNYQGITNRNPNVWDYKSDGYNDIGFFIKGNTGTITLAGTISNLSGNNKIILETDTTFNTYYDFSTVGAAEKYDVQNVMTHEFGHWVKLNDLSSLAGPSWCEIWEFESTMCGIIYTNETRKRSLEGDDKDGIKAIYGI